MAAVSFDRELVVSAVPATAWAILTDVPRLVSWISIVSDAREITELEHYSAVLTDRLGPFKLRADLDIVVSDVVVGERIHVRADGEDRQVSSRIGVEATLTLSDTPESGCRVSVSGHYEVIGKVATMGAGMIRQKAAKILDEFFDHAARELGA